MKTKIFIIAVVCFGLFLLAVPQNASAQNRSSANSSSLDGSSNVRQGGSGPIAGVVAQPIVPTDPDNPPDFRDPNDPRKILDYNCSGRIKRTTPGTFRWSCTSSMSCSCNLTYRDDNGRVQTCAASPLSRSLSGSGADSNRNSCINEADADLDSERDSFFAECQAALANCPP